MLYTADVQNVKNVLEYINSTRSLIQTAYKELNSTEGNFKLEFIKVLSAIDTDLSELFDKVQGVVTCVDESGVVS